MQCAAVKQAAAKFTPTSEVGETNGQESCWRPSQDPVVGAMLT